LTENELKWTVTSTEELLRTPVFDVMRQHERSATGIEGDYIAMEAHDWAMVIAEHEGRFLMVRQWRHSSEYLSMEFPGGVVDSGESPADAAARELSEETGFKAGRLIHLGSCYPNPALFKNRFHVFLAEELTPTGEQKLDDDELLTWQNIPTDEVISSYGRGEYNHALMGTALFFYMRHKSTRGNSR